MYPCWNAPYDVAYRMIGPRPGYNTEGKIDAEASQLTFGPPSNRLYLSIPYKGLEIVFLFIVEVRCLFVIHDCASG